jgi:hypothetical protein
MPLVTVERSYTTKTLIEITEEELTILKTSSKAMAEERGRVRRGILSRTGGQFPGKLKFEGGAIFEGDTELFDFN